MDSRVRAVVAAAGGLDGRRTIDQLGPMPPTLILHGDRDGIVSVRRAHQVAQVLEAIGTPYELRSRGNRARAAWTGFRLLDELRRRLLP